jgi:hypothetical protein
MQHGITSTSHGNTTLDDVNHGLAGHSPIYFETGEKGRSTRRAIFTSAQKRRPRRSSAPHALSALLEVQQESTVRCSIAITSAERAVQTTPDYWTALLWKRLMGRKVLRASVSGTGSNVASLLVFVHCSQRSGSKGGVSAVIVNTDKGNTTLDLSHSPELRGT